MNHDPQRERRVKQTQMKSTTATETGGATEKQSAQD